MTLMTILNFLAVKYFFWKLLKLNKIQGFLLIGWRLSWKLIDGRKILFSKPVTGLEPPDPVEPIFKALSSVSVSWKSLAVPAILSNSYLNWGFRDVLNFWVISLFCRSDRFLLKWRIVVEMTDFYRSDKSKWRVEVTNLCQSDGSFAVSGTRNRELFLLIFLNTISKI